MDFRPIQPDLVKYEMRMVQGEDVFTKHQKKPGGFGRFLSGIGRLFGSVLAPLSFIFPPAMIGALGMYGVGKIGDQVQQSSYNKAMQKQAVHTPTAAVYPGAEDIMGGPVSSLSPVQADIMNVLYARNDMMMESSHAMEKRSI